MTIMCRFTGTVYTFAECFSKWLTAAWVFDNDLGSLGKMFRNPEEKKKVPVN